METIFSQILFLSILSIFVLQTNSIEKLYLSSHFQKMKNYLKHNSLLSKANTLITKTKILRYLAGHQIPLKIEQLAIKQLATRLKKLPECYLIKRVYVIIFLKNLIRVSSYIVIAYHVTNANFIQLLPFISPYTQ